MPFPIEILRSGVKIANSLTRGVQCNISHEAMIGTDGMGSFTYASSVNRKCVVDMTTRVIKMGGELITVAATLTFVGDVPANGAVTDPPRVEPIDPRDRITLPNGWTGPIISSPGAVIDPGTNRGIIQEVMLGAR